MSRPGVTRERSGIDPVTVLTRVLFVVAFAALVVRGVGHLLRAGEPEHLLAAALAAGYLLWLAAEVPVTFRHPAQPVAEVRTLAVYACSRLALVIVAVAPDVPWSGFSWWMVPAVALFVAGIVLRLVAIRALGALYTHHVLRRDEHPIVTGGPYRLVRHPAYAGMLLANVGFVLFFLNPASVLALLALTGALVWRIRTEERVLWAAPGYPEFATGRARLVPGVW
ncbi:isoprenylcysteine carboxylmethyltransferase family protein [Micromonospora sp. WMMD882]|uniref:methyltransferase family protein n=1 Tax=Micromonospora sp. WMMD882 TaxID=3015151 RepID=UPI00248CF99E|nr:isoprenylcysteine carboxylmethyltransferase family protein [Micromonospora sp. WMMD882]WBB80677.1 isoprenylcysteine carboxylmethyltransferase family protein [Micromonospora sp. WMMD882]